MRPPLTDLETHSLMFVTPRELAGYLRVDARTILRMIEGDVLYAVKVGRVWRIPITEARRAFPVERARRDDRRIS